MELGIIGRGRTVHIAVNVPEQYLSTLHRSVREWSYPLCQEDRPASKRQPLARAFAPEATCQRCLNRQAAAAAAPAAREAYCTECGAWETGGDDYSACCNAPIKFRRVN